MSMNMGGFAGFAPLFDVLIRRGGGAIETGCRQAEMLG